MRIFSRLFITIQLLALASPPAVAILGSFWAMALAKSIDVFGKELGFEWILAIALFFVVVLLMSAVLTSLYLSVRFVIGGRPALLRTSVWWFVVGDYCFAVGLLAIIPMALTAFYDEIYFLATVVISLLSALWLVPYFCISSEHAAANNSLKADVPDGPPP